MLLDSCNKFVSYIVFTQILLLFIIFSLKFDFFCFTGNTILDNAVFAKFCA